MIINSEKLWMDGGYGEDNPLDNSINYVKKVAVEEGLSHADGEAIVAQFFIELANGIKHSTKGCGCGCDSVKSGTAAVHYMLDKVMAKAKVVREFKQKEFGDSLNDAIVGYIEAQNDAFIKEHMKPPFRLWNWEKSPVIKGIKKTYGFLFNRKQRPISYQHTE